MDRIFIFKFSEKVDKSIYDSCTFNEALSIYVSYFISLVFIRNGYYEILEKDVFVNNRKVDIINNEKDILNAFNYSHINTFYFNILKRELVDFIQSLENSISFRLIKYGSSKIYINCFATSSSCVISLES